jgi:hypothetical protein
MSDGITHVLTLLLKNIIHVRSSVASCFLCSNCYKHEANQIVMVQMTTRTIANQPFVCRSEALTICGLVNT